MLTSVVPAMQITTGFIVLAACGLLAVVAPTTFAVWQLWRKGGVVRAFAMTGCVLIVALAALAFVGVDELPRQWEEATLVFLLLWGISFYALLGFSIVALALKRAVGRTRRSRG